MSGARHRRREHDDDDDEDQKYSRGGGSGSSSNSGSDHKSKLGGPRGSYWDYYVPKPEEPCPPPPIVNGYALEGLETMPSTGGAACCLPLGVAVSFKRYLALAINSRYIFCNFRRHQL